MSNPTSNFGWQMPTPVDLVTDLPADFEVFGQAVDSSLADLKGGTTGQILAKATNTDMDFVWITNDQGDITGITATSPLTGGGTSGAVTVGIQDASTSQKGSVQLSDSTSTTSSVLAATPTAVKSAYDLAASAYAPAFTNNFYAGKNKIINGDFSINQRGFTSTTTALTYGFDRWAYDKSGGTVTYSTQSFTNGGNPVAGYNGTKYARIVTASQSAAGDYAYLTQRIENAFTFAGQNVTVSFWAKAASGTPKVAIALAPNQGGVGQVYQYAGQVTLSTSWVRYSATITLNQLSSLGYSAGSYLELLLWTSAGSTYNSATGSMGIQNATIDFWGVQVEAGSTATPFQTATGTIQGELAACQRYFAKSYNQATAPATNTSANGLVFAQSGATVASAAYFANVPLPVTMRANPTVTIYSFTSSQTARVSDGAGTDLAANSGATNLINDSRFTVQNNSGGALTAATGGFVFHYTVSAEL